MQPDFTTLIGGYLAPRRRDMVQRVIPGQEVGVGMLFLPPEGDLRLAGLGEPETLGRWSVADAFSASLPRPEAVDGMILVARIGPVFRPLGDLHMTVLINGRVVEEVVFGDRLEDCVLRHPLAHFEPSRDITLTCVLFEPVSPAMAGISPDTRRLGVVLRTIGLIHDGRTDARIIDGQDCAFSSEGEGWHDHDVVRWSKDDPARLVLPAQALCSRSLALQITVNSIIPQKNVRLCVGDLSKTFDVEGTTSIVLNGDFSATEGDISVTFSNYDVQAPSNISDSDDTRMIGVGLVQLIVNYEITNRGGDPI